MFIYNYTTKWGDWIRRSGYLNLTGSDQSQTNDLHIDTCNFIAKHSALLEYGKEWLTQWQDNMTEWVIGLGAGGLVSSGAAQ